MIEGLHGDDRTIKSDIHSLYTLEETAKKRVKSKEGDAVLKGIHGDDRLDWDILTEVAKRRAGIQNRPERELCNYCSLDEEDKGVHQSSFGSIFPVYCEESGKCDEAYENYLEEVNLMGETMLSYYEVIAIDRKEEEIVIERKVIAKDVAMAEGKAGLNAKLIDYDYDRSKLAIKVTKIMDIKLLTEEE